MHLAPFEKALVASLNLASLFLHCGIDHDYLGRASFQETNLPEQPLRVEVSRGKGVPNEHDSSATGKLLPCNEPKLVQNGPRADHLVRGRWNNERLTPFVPAVGTFVHFKEPQEPLAFDRKPCLTVPMPVLSTSTGIAPSEVTQSAMTSAPTSLGAMQMASPRWKAPAEVSACTYITTLGFSSRINSAASWSPKTSPQGFSKRTSSAPWRRAISDMRSQKKPLANDTTFIPGKTKLEMAVSMPPLPVAEMTKVNSFLVPKTVRSSR